MHKSIVLLIGLVISFVSTMTVASTHGGGVLMSALNLPKESSQFKNQTEIVYHMGQQDGLVKFSYGHLVGQNWEIKKIEMTEADLATDSVIVKALENSKALNSWVEIK